MGRHEWHAAASLLARVGHALDTRYQVEAADPYSNFSRQALILPLPLRVTIMRSVVEQLKSKWINPNVLANPDPSLVRVVQLSLS